MLLLSYKIGRPLVFIWLHSVYEYANVDNGFPLDRRFSMSMQLEFRDVDSGREYWHPTLGLRA